jgi:NAD(P)-dependent dehydrogenase (short-subunit alcohol dehydrogenase family)
MQFWKRAARPGDIVTVTSLAGIRGLQRFAGLSAYAASKHAIVGLTEALALEGRHSNIRINAIAPGAMATSMSAALGLSPQTSPDAVVPTIEFLLDRKKSAVITGTTIEIHCNDD